MNFKKQAQQLEMYLAQEFESNAPLTVVNDEILMYKQFKIVKNDSDNWVISRMNSDALHTFKLRSTAILAAKYYDKFLYKNVEELKILDYDYWMNTVDVSFFKHRVKSSTGESRDIFLSRLDMSSAKADFLKREIIKRLKYDF